MKNISYKTLYVSLAATLLFTGCSSEIAFDNNNLSDKEIKIKVEQVKESSDGSRATEASSIRDGLMPAIKADNSDSKPMYLQSYVEKTASRRHFEGISKDSRASLTTDNLTSFGLLAYRYASGSSATTPNFMHNEQVNKSGNKWQTSQQYNWPVNSDKLDFYAYAPYNGTGITLSGSTDPGAPTIDFTMQTAAANQIDLITATAANKDITNASSGVAFTFDHALTTVKFVKGADLVGSIESITLKNIYTSGVLTIGGSWDFTNKTATEEYEAAMNTSYMMIPQTFGSTAAVEVEYNDGLNTYTLSFSLNDITWQAGTTITYTISSSAISLLHLGTITYGSTLHASMPKKAFANGEMAGLYVVDASGNIKHDNVKLTYNGSSWTAASAVVFSPLYDYYVYYPYKESGIANSGASSAKQMSRSTGITVGSATSFFADGISAWDLTDQSTSSKFNDADLQIAKGYVTSLDGLTLNFDMTHAFGLARFTLSQNYANEKYLSIDNSYTWGTSATQVTATSTFSSDSYKAYSYSTRNYLVWVKAGVATTIKSDAGETDKWKSNLTFNVAANTLADNQTAYSTRATRTSFTLTEGDILYSDGSLSHQSESLLSGKTAVAIVFLATTSSSSPVTTANDRSANANWKHGYAMALKNVHSSGTSTGTYKWAESEYASTDLEGVNNPGTSTWQTRISDMDGYTNTTYLNNSNYPAGYAAATTYASQATAPTASSGWFLPSTGQWYWILVNLGGMSATPDNSYYWSGNTSSNFTSSICATALNNKLSVVGNGNYDAFFSNTSSTVYYWSSSEYSSSYAYHAYFGSSGRMNFASNDYKTNTYRVRPVLAF